MSTNCGNCQTGRHVQCGGDTWDDDTNRPTLCDCWEHDHHGMHWPGCDLCGERIPPGHHATHLAADHGIPGSQP